MADGWSLKQKHQTSRYPTNIWNVIHYMSERGKPRVECILALAKTKQNLCRLRTRGSSLHMDLDPQNKRVVLGNTAVWFRIVILAVRGHEFLVISLKPWLTFLACFRRKPCSSNVGLKLLSKSRPLFSEGGSSSMDGVSRDLVLQWF